MGVKDVREGMKIITAVATQSYHAIPAMIMTMAGCPL